MELFQHSSEAINIYISVGLSALVSISAQVIKPTDPTFARTPTKIQRDDCIGVIDEMRVEIKIANDEKITFIRRCRAPMQNVMAVCDFNMSFTFAVPVGAHFVEQNDDGRESGNINLPPRPNVANSPTIFDRESGSHRRPAMDRGQYLQQFVDETEAFNNIVLGLMVPESIWRPLPSMLKSWLRNYIGGNLLYFVSGFIWCFYIYYLKRNVYIPKDAMPSYRAMKLQIIVAMKAMPYYSA
ncbi:uncharacterized protein LOC110026203, partial [Phalaenopsis equestris]|uniref:uncharacterized protein LOC110026203 n=1 Tax=Phalaenopsis equestris TaxID=78828 RepID=UPI0009E5197C